MEKTYSISYDREADVFYLNFCKGRKGVAEEIDSGVYARYDAETHELIGLTILNFSKKFTEQYTDLKIPAYQK